MNIFRLAFELFVIYMIYKLVFGFIIPVYNTTRQMKQKMGEMQQNMHDQKTHQAEGQIPKNTPAPSSSTKDYIEFEEIK